MTATGSGAEPLVEVELLLATGNAGKVVELRRLLTEAADEHPALRAVTVVGLEVLEAPLEVEETEETFEGNALLKARAYAGASARPTLSDDSGLEVDALGGAPGVHSARYGGTHGDDEANNERVLRELADVADAERGGRFRCALAFVDLNAGYERVTHGALEGRLLRERRGDGGFGYDPLFVPDGFARTTAEMSRSEKNAISHRARATRAMIPHVVEWLARRAG